MGQRTKAGCISQGNRASDPGSLQAPPERIDGARLAAVKEQQLLVSLAEQLAQAQFRQADQVRSRRLWQEAALLELDPERLIHLLYAGEGSGDRQAMMQLDQRWCRHQASRSGTGSVGSWLRNRVFKQRPSGSRGLPACSEALDQQLLHHVR